MYIRVVCYYSYNKQSMIHRCIELDVDLASENLYLCSSSL